MVYFFLSLRLKFLIFNSGICPNWLPTMCIPFRMNAVIKMYSWSHGMMSRLTMPANGGIYFDKIDAICFVFSISLWCLLRFSVAGLTWPERHPVEWEACNPLVDDAYTPSYIVLSTMNFLITSSTDSYKSMGLPDILIVKQMGQGRQTDKKGRQTDNDILVSSNKWSQCNIRWVR